MRTLAAWMLTGLLLPTAAAQVTIATWPGAFGLGFRVAPLGDVNGDGHADLAATASLDTSFGGLGSVHVLSGLEGAALLSFGSPGSSSYGEALAAAGDADLDGVPDVVLGAYSTQIAGLQAGLAELRSGADGALLHGWPGVAGDLLGADVAGAGDVDADGHADVLVSAPMVLDADAGRGRIELRSGATGSVLFLHEGTLVNEGVGTSPAGLGDVNGDGRADFAWSSKQDLAASGLARANVRIVSGASLATLFSLDGWGSVAAAGDVNGDGHADAFLADRGQSPSFQGRLALLSGADAQLFMLVSVPSAKSVASVGDLDGDGCPEAVLDDGDVRSGRTGALLCELGAAADYDGAGDVDGDGEPEIARGLEGAVLIQAYQPPTLLSLQPAELQVAYSWNATVRMVGDDLSSVTHVYVGDWGVVSFSHAGPTAIEFQMPLVDALGPVPVTVSNSTGTLVAEPIILLVEETHPPVMEVPTLAFTGETVPWKLFGEAKAFGFVLAWNGWGTVPVGGWQVLWPSLVIGVVPLDELGRGHFELQMPAAAGGAALITQLVTVDGGILGASEVEDIIVLF